MGVPIDNPMAWQTGYLPNELAYIVAHAPDPARSGFVASHSAPTLTAANAAAIAADPSADPAAVAAAAEAAAAAATADFRPLEPAAEVVCPICFDPLQQEGVPLDYSYCSLGAGGCGNVFHRNCEWWRRRLW